MFVTTYGAASLMRFELKTDSVWATPDTLRRRTLVSTMPAGGPGRTARGRTPNHFVELSRYRWLPRVGVFAALKDVRRSPRGGLQMAATNTTANLGRRRGWSSLAASFPSSPPNRGMERVVAGG